MSQDFKKKFEGLCSASKWFDDYSGKIRTDNCTQNIDSDMAERKQVLIANQ